MSETGESTESAEVRLTVDFCGEAHEVGLGQALTFGRAADLAVDENPYMHRTVGRFHSRADVWWIHNVGSRIPLTVVDTDTRARAFVTPEAEAALTLTQGVVRFEAGPTTYELEILIERPNQVPYADLSTDHASANETITVAELPLTSSQRRLILALAEPMLLDSSTDRTLVPTNRDAANRLDLRMPQFNRGLDRLCAKLTRQGVTGLGGNSANLAVDRRERLVQWAVDNRVVTVEHLPALEEGPQLVKPGDTAEHPTRQME